MQHRSRSQGLRLPLSLLVVLTVSVGSYATSRVLAETDPTVEATEAHERGIVAFAHGKFKEAATAFALADKLWPDPSLSYNLARTYEQLHDDARSLQHYRDYLQRSPQAEDRKAVQLKIDQLAQRVSAGSGLVIVRLDAEPAGAEIKLDDEPVTNAPLEVQLPPGSHRAHFTLDGFEAQDITFEVVAGQPLPEVHPILQPLDAHAIAQAREAEEATRPRMTAAEAALLDSNFPRSPHSSTETPLLRHVGVGAIIGGVAAFGGAIAFESIRSDAAHEAMREPEQIRFAQALDRMETRQTWARVFLGTGVALTTLGITLLVLSRDQEHKPSFAPEESTDGSSDSPQVTLHCAPNDCGAELRGMF